MLKTRLPYFVGSSFKDNIRHSDFFELASYLTLDVDGYSDGNVEIPELVLAHKAVLIAFVSPSGTGFKIIFRLNVPCQSLKQYREFYQAFSRVFAEEVNLVGSIDMKTCDATRACFLSFDSNVVYNPSALPVEWQRYVGQEITEYEVIENQRGELNEETLGKVLDKINPTRPKKKVFQGYVPEELENMKPDIANLCTINNLTLVDILPISYGLKIQIKEGYRQAEINVFYGKKGYTVTRSPKTGTDPVLSERVYALVSDLIFASAPIANSSVDLIQLLNLN